MSNKEKKMSGHKHAALMLQYAEDAAKTNKPWELWELKGIEGEWNDLINHPGWGNNSEYRRKPVKWEPVGGNWWICFIGDVVCNGDSTPYSREFGHERPTKEQAERAAVEMRKFNRLLALRDEFGAGNWIIGKTNYYIYYDYINGKYRVCTNSSTQIMGAVYFTSQESVKKACEMLNSGEVEL